MTTLADGDSGQFYPAGETLSMVPWSLADRAPAA